MRYCYFSSDFIPLFNNKKENIFQKKYCANNFSSFNENNYKNLRIEKTFDVLLKNYFMFIKLNETDVYLNYKWTLIFNYSVSFKISVITEFNNNQLTKLTFFNNFNSDFYYEINSFQEEIFTYNNFIKENWEGIINVSNFLFYFIILLI